MNSIVRHDFLCNASTLPFTLSYLQLFLPFLLNALFLLPSFLTKSQHLIAHLRQAHYDPLAWRDREEKWLESVRLNYGNASDKRNMKVDIKIRLKAADCATFPTDMKPNG